MNVLCSLLYSTTRLVVDSSRESAGFSPDEIPAFDFYLCSFGGGGGHIKNL
jgi:hypothetical protein